MCIRDSASVVDSNVGDADCDGVGTAIDCDDADASVVDSNVGDADCDGVGSAIDCDDGNASVVDSNVGDADCDGIGSTVDCDDGNPAEVRALLDVNGCEALTHSLSAGDPFQCGVGFFGEIAGGLAPYNLIYTLTPPDGAPVVLPATVVDQAGSYNIPPGIIDFSTITGLHRVVLAITDSAGATLNPAATFDAVITDVCVRRTVVRGPAITAPDPVATVAETPVATADVAQVAAQDAGAADAPRVIALTGVNSDVPFQTALLLLGAGFTSLAFQRRRGGGFYKS